LAEVNHTEWEERSKKVRYVLDFSALTNPRLNVLSVRTIIVMNI